MQDCRKDSAAREPAGQGCRDVQKRAEECRRRGVPPLLPRRLETFKPLTWFGKPDECSAVECARKG